MKHIHAAATFAAIALAGSAQAAIIVHNAPFIGAISNFNGFEGLGPQYSFTGPYTEGGITVEYIGSAGIWSTSQAAEGSYSWYENGGGTGFTDIKLAGGGDIGAIEFQAGSGWYGAGASLQYQLLKGGLTVQTGVAGPLSGYTGFTTYGFSGGGFDEVRLQGAQGAGPFDPAAYEAAAYDAIAIGPGGAIPEPGTWALMITGFALCGMVLRTRRRLESA